MFSVPNLRRADIISFRGRVAKNAKDYAAQQEVSGWSTVSYGEKQMPISWPMCFLRLEFWGESD